MALAKKWPHSNLCQITKMFIMNFYVPLATQLFTFTSQSFIFHALYLSFFELIKVLIKDVNNTTSLIYAGQYN